jgi:hypothetical protein
MAATVGDIVAWEFCKNFYHFLWTELIFYTKLAKMKFSLKRRLNITGEILKTLQGTVASIAQVEGLLGLFEIPAEDFEARIFILSRLAEIAREVSIKAFRSEELRMHIIDAIQGSLDRYIEREDEFFEEVQ